MFLVVKMLLTGPQDLISSNYLGLNSEWMCGAAYLKKYVEEWPINRSFAEKKSKISFPHEEVSRKFRSKIETVGKVLKGQGLVVLDDVDAGGPGSEDNYVLKMVEFGIKTIDWKELIRSTTFKFYWVAKVREHVRPVGGYDG